MPDPIIRYVVKKDGKYLGANRPDGWICAALLSEAVLINELGPTKLAVNFIPGSTIHKVRVTIEELEEVK